MLADADHQVSEAYGVYNLYGSELAGPAVFVVGQDGSVLWSYLGVEPIGADKIVAQLP
jgi:peroxiredoxin